MLILFGAIYGNKPTPMFGGRGAMNVSVPAYIALIIVTVALIGLPVSTAAARESGVLRRFRATPLHPLAYIVSDILSYLLTTLVGVLLLSLTGRLAFHVRFEGNILSVLAGFLLGTLAFFALGYLVAGLAPTARLAQTVGMVLAFPMMFLSGATIPPEIMPAGVRAFSRYIPLTYVVALMKGLWLGEPWSGHWTEIAVLGGYLLMGGGDRRAAVPLGMTLARRWGRFGDRMRDEAALMRESGLAVIHREEFGPWRCMRVVVGER